MNFSAAMRISVLLGVLLWTGQPVDWCALLTGEVTKSSLSQFEKDTEIEELKLKATTSSLVALVEFDIAHALTIDCPAESEHIESCFEWHLRGPPALI